MGSKAEGDNISGSEEKNILVAYFSHSGNTRVIADQIYKIVGGDIKGKPAMDIAYKMGKAV